MAAAILEVVAGETVSQLLFHDGQSGCQGFRLSLRQWKCRGYLLSQR